MFGFNLGRIICQTAGKLQGLRPGDLGDMGEGTLNYKTIMRLLDIFMKSILSYQSTQSSTSSDKFPDVYKLLLEVTVRYIFCAQRIYISRMEWDIQSDPIQEIIYHIESQPYPDIHY